MLNPLIQLIPVSKLKHIEHYSQKRSHWLAQKILTEKAWKKPLCIDKEHHLVMDGQHRMEVAKILGLTYVPCILFDYFTVKIWSLRCHYAVTHELVIQRALKGDIYPYKTVKHAFPIDIPEMILPLDELSVLVPEAI